MEKIKVSKSRHEDEGFTFNYIELGGKVLGWIVTRENGETSLTYWEKGFEDITVHKKDGEMEHLLVTEKDSE